MTAQIIQFPVQHSNGYNNLTQLFEICDSLESCNFYLESVEQLFRKGYISEKEMYTLRRIGRGKRLELTQPEEQEPQEATEHGVYQYTPEMGGAKPDCQMEASRGYYGGHWFIDTPLEIKGRGITFLKKYTERCTHTEKEKAEGDTSWMILFSPGIIQKRRQSKGGKGT